MGGSKYRLRIIGRFPAHLTGNLDHVSASILAGPDWDHLSMCGTVTMTESEWDDLVDALRRGAGDDVDVEDAGGRR
ncbi:MAG TPA: hypothetical protein VHJ34_04915 [Actinomycetota bacterium]|nr:hypothetical protein [Actinomycetota bacterium]